MRSLVFLLSVLAASCLFADGASADHTESVSVSVAVAFCQGHGGGTQCHFCHYGHCHTVWCNSDGCHNRVSTRVAHSHGGAPRSPSAGKASGGNPPPKGRHRPVRITGYKPPSGVKTTGGNSAPVTIQRREEHHSGGGHK